MDSVNEGSTSYLRLDFVDKDGVAAIPTGIVYTVIDEASGEIIRANGIVSVPAASVVLTLDATDNTIVNIANRAEIRVVTVTATYNTNDVLNNVHRYELVNLRAI